MYNNSVTLGYASNNQIQSASKDNTPVPDNSCDYMFIFAVLHHVTYAQQDTIMQEVVRVARKKVFVIEGLIYTHNTVHRMLTYLADSA